MDERLKHRQARQTELRVQEIKTQILRTEINIDRHQDEIERDKEAITALKKELQKVGEEANG